MTGLAPSIGVVPDTADVGVLQWLLAADYGRGFADRDVRTRVDVWLPLPARSDGLPRDTHPVLTLGRMAAAAVADRRAAGARRRSWPRSSSRFPSTAPAVRMPSRSPTSCSAACARAVGVAGGCRPRARHRRASTSRTCCSFVARRRLREVAVRTALGATPRRLTRQFLVENALLARRWRRPGNRVSFALVRACSSLVARRRAAPRPPSASMAACSRSRSALTAVVALAFGLVPVLQARRLDVIGGAGRRRRPRRRPGAGRFRRVRSGWSSPRLRSPWCSPSVRALMIRTVLRLGAVNPGFDVATACSRRSSSCRPAAIPRTSGGGRTSSRCTASTRHCSSRCGACPASRPPRSQAAIRWTPASPTRSSRRTRSESRSWPEIACGG